MTEAEAEGEAGAAESVTGLPLAKIYPEKV